MLYLTKNKNGQICLWTKKPYKDEKEGVWTYNKDNEHMWDMMTIGFESIHDIFPDASWNDKYPIEVELYANPGRNIINLSEESVEKIKIDNLHEHLKTFNLNNITITIGRCLLLNNITEGLMMRELYKIIKSSSFRNNKLNLNIDDTEKIILDARYSEMKYDIKSFRRTIYKGPYDESMWIHLWHLNNQLYWRLYISDGNKNLII